MPYFVTIKHTRGIPYLYVMHSVYVRRPDGTNHKVQRVVRSFGRLEPLLAKDPKFVEKLRMMYPTQRQLKKLKLEKEAAQKEKQLKTAKAKTHKVEATNQESQDN